MQLFFTPHIDENSNTFSFDKDESRHIVKVLRKAKGDLLTITNGKGWLFEAEILQPDQKQCSVAIISKTKQPPRPYTVHLAVAPTKMNDRFEWFLEKATEIGVDRITPLLCEHSERRVIKKERYEKVIQAATKQSLHYYMPELDDLTLFDDFIKEKFTGEKYIAHCEETEKKSLKTELKPGSHVTILIGPEGDFSSREITEARNSGFKPISLGDTRLRTETAAIVACHSIAFINE
ncbi:16S rRNA (uracil(1498)-N(3))-methyltransferase [Gaetbulibacter aestuarii]|uniref:Ribosomal RNA small subunit methyltransferase E n=1 Tax=Gaetbulibacter aestuarii TaxID=1502358 RepID=A0ABW7MZW6_9FLAO